MTRNSGSPELAPASVALLLGEQVQEQPLEAKRAALPVPGEERRMQPLPGLLYVTNHRLLWESKTSDPIKELDRIGANSMCVPLLAIDRVRSRRNEHEIAVEIFLKYDALPALRINMKEMDAHHMGTLIKRHQALQTNLQHSFAVAHGLALGAGRRVGWDAYDAQAEFQRQGLKNPLSQWRICLLNAKFLLCGTYPRLLVVPRSFPDADVEKVAAFRSGARLPVLCWKDPMGVASICRCSQPLVGVSKSRSAEDEALLQAIADTNPFSERLQIIDCRPRLNAELNAAKGKGYEHSSQYANIKLCFMDISNIHVMRASLKSLLQLLAPRQRDSADDDFLADLSKCAQKLSLPLPKLPAGVRHLYGRCGWLEHIRSVLRASVRVANLIHHERSSVLVHCSDGWDRTPQVTALAQLLLDGAFRSILGFGVLVCKEWLSFGHQFALRCGTVAPLDKGHHSPGEEQLSPVFLQFVESVWQLTQQFPTAFEFNSRYLANLLDLALSGTCGTFLGNSERQRAAASLHLCSSSAWELLQVPANHNLDFTPTNAVLLPDCNACQLRVWTAYYCRAGQALRLEPVTLLEERCAALRDERDALRAELTWLHSQHAYSGTRVL